MKFKLNTRYKVEHLREDRRCLLYKYFDSREDAIQFAEAWLLVNTDQNSVGIKEFEEVTRSDA